MRLLYLAWLCLSFSAVAQTIPSAPNVLDNKGVRIGQWVLLYDQYGSETAVPDSMVFYRTLTFSDQGQPVGLVQDTYRSGKPRFTGQLALLTPRPYYSGNCVWYYETGQKSREGHFFVGIADSLYSEWNLAGELLFQAQYKRSTTGQIQAVVRVDKLGQSLVRGLQPPMASQQTYSDYFTKELLPLAGQKAGDDGASSVLRALWINEQAYRACVQRFSSKGSMCTPDVKRLADTYAALGYSKAGWYYAKALELADTFIGPYSGDAAELPNLRVMPAYTDYLYDYALYSARIGQFGQACHLVDRVLAYNRQVSEQQKMTQYDLLNYIDFYIALQAYDQVRKLITSQEVQLTNGSVGTDLLQAIRGESDRNSLVRGLDQRRFLIDAKQNRPLNGRNADDLISDGFINVILSRGDAYMRARNYIQAEQTYQQAVELMNRNYNNNVPEPYNLLEVV